MSPTGIGEVAPNFRSRNQRGQPVTRADLTGAPAVLVFYPWAFSGICTRELGAIRDDLARFEGVGARVLAISCDAMFSLRVYADTERLGFDLLTDHWPHGAIAKAYGVFDENAGCALRGSFVLDAAGIVTWRVINTIGEARDIAAHIDALPAA